MFPNLEPQFSHLLDGISIPAFLKGISKCQVLCKARAGNTASFLIMSLPLLFSIYAAFLPSCDSTCVP